MSQFDVISIIGKFGGQTKMAADLNANISTVGMWKKRRSIPAKWWPEILRVAKERQIPLEPTDLLVAQGRNHA